eukprot:TRINITY_DN3162_c0_g1_i2.p2 TRINITY_DN3162_c0_g1~~TRINITY_DN3162_c0_g1_i2.p2  ORF type:complete len:126 (+),score=22.18 TRINITY_DN3162_c0_g1_i2:541-918(+)
MDGMEGAAHAVTEPAAHKRPRRTTTRTGAISVANVDSRGALEVGNRVNVEWGKKNRRYDAIVLGLDWKRPRDPVLIEFSQSKTRGRVALSKVHRIESVSYTHLRAHETPEHLVCRLLLEKKKKKT